jgi:hypothetical protein
MRSKMSRLKALYAFRTSGCSENRRRVRGGRGSCRAVFIRTGECRTQGTLLRESPTSLCGPCYQRFLLQPCQRLDLRFSFQGRAASGVRLLVFHANRKTASRVAGSGPGIVLPASTVHILGDACIKRAVRTSQDVNEPRIGFHRLSGSPFPSPLQTLRMPLHPSASPLDPSLMVVAHPTAPFDALPSEPAFPPRSSSASSVGGTSSSYPLSAPCRPDLAIGRGIFLCSWQWPG